MVIKFKCIYLNLFTVRIINLCFRFLIKEKEAFMPPKSLMLYMYVMFKFTLF